MVPSQPRLDDGMLKDERVAEEFVNRLSGDLGVGSGCFGESCRVVECLQNHHL